MKTLFESLMRLRKYLQRTCIQKAFSRSRYWMHRYLKQGFWSPHETSLPVNDVPTILDKPHFFGYYNLSPTNLRNELLYCTADGEHIRESERHQSSVIYIAENAKPTEIAKTKAWNWQQGCMLQWMPPKYDLIIHNDYDQLIDRYVSRLIDFNGHMLRTYSLPVYSISRTGKFALTLNFDRLALLRPDYGYFNRKPEALLPDGQDGVWRLDLENGDVNLIITLEQLKGIKPTDTMDGADHKVNHIDINHSGTRFMFLHRWVGPQGRFMRLITAAGDGTELFVLNGDKMTSHSCWRNDNEIISFCHVEGSGNGYYRFVDQVSGAVLVSENLPKEDGHPSTSSNGRWMITDTYPDRARMAWLILYDMQNDEIITLGRFYQPLRYNGEMRIDLHPKWAKDEKSIYFESGHEGKRRLYWIDISQIVDR